MLGIVWQKGLQSYLSQKIILTVHEENDPNSSQLKSISQQKSIDNSGETSLVKDQTSNQTLTVSGTDKNENGLDSQTKSLYQEKTSMESNGELHVSQNSNHDYLYILKCKFCKSDFKTKSDIGKSIF